MLRLKSVCQNCVLGSCVNVVHNCYATFSFFILFFWKLEHRGKYHVKESMFRCWGYLLHSFDLGLNFIYSNSNIKNNNSGRNWF